MTGFARAEGAENGYSWTWEIRSVNARAMDTRLRVPSGMERLEARLKPAVAERFVRGNISASLALSRPQRQTTLAVNNEILDQVIEIAKDISGRIKATPPTIDGLLSVRGVLDAVEAEESDEEREALENAIVVSFETGLDGLKENRGQEGGRLAEVVKGHLEDIASLSSRASGASAASAAAVEKRLRDQISALLKDDPALPEDRLAQEVALLVAKGDIREELDRLQAHVDAARDLLESDEPIGRPFDFLCQEFNREANTLCSKASDIELTRLGLDLKASIERLREQIQNIE
ncbi:MAG: YicC family protein [Rhodospirillaceae bacterium]|jgi:uncharacterized protein (TIGR00255 family)|nr:YicC family protein [Rhodospirillaceae bacterium]